LPGTETTPPARRSIDRAVSVVALAVLIGTTAASREAPGPDSGRSRHQDAGAADLHFDPIGAVGGATTAVAVHGSFVYLGTGMGALAVVDVRDPARPRIAGRAEYLPGFRPGAISAIRIRGDRAYVAAGAGGLRIFDLTLPAAPRELGRIDVPDRARDVAVEGRYAFVAGDRESIVVDVTDPDRPVRAAALGGPATGIDVEGGLAFVAASDLRVFDVRVPTEPRLVGRAGLTDADDVVVTRGFAFVAAWHTLLYVLDVADPARPRRLASLPAPPRTRPEYGGWRCCRRLQVAGGRAFVANPTQGIFRVIDVGDPGEPREVAGYDLPFDLGPWDLAIDGRHAYLSVGEITFGSGAGSDVDASVGGGLRVLDVGESSDDDTPPREVGRLVPLYRAETLATDGRLVFAGSDRTLHDVRLHVIDAGLPAAPRELGAVGVGGASAIAPLAGRPYVLVAAGNQPRDKSIAVVDISRPAEPRVVHHPRLSDPRDEWPSAGVDLLAAERGVAVAIEDRTVHILDAREPAGLREINTAQLSSWPTQVALRGGLAYLAGVGLEIMDLRDPLRPRALGSLYLPRVTYALAVDGGYAYLATWIEDRDPARPRLAGSVEVPRPGQSAFAAVPHGIAVAGDLVLVAVGPDGYGIVAYDVTDPAAPRLATSWMLPDHGAQGLAIAGCVAYAAQGEGGLLAAALRGGHRAPPLATPGAPRGPWARLDVLRYFPVLYRDNPGDYCLLRAGGSRRNQSSTSESRPVARQIDVSAAP